MAVKNPQGDKGGGGGGGYIYIFFGKGGGGGKMGEVVRGNLT